MAIICHLKAQYQTVEPNLSLYLILINLQNMRPTLHFHMPWPPIILWFLSFTSNLLYC